MDIPTLKALPLFKNCPDRFFQDLCATAHIQNHEKGKILIIHEDPATRFFVIQHGWVKLFRETPNGAESVIDILPSGHVFGETALFENGVYPYSAEIVETAEIISLSLSVLKLELEHNSILTTNMLKYMARQQRKQDQEIEHRTLQNASQRIGCFLLQLTGSEYKTAKKIRLPYDKTLVASRLGMKPETFSRALGKLKKSTGIRIKGKTIEIDDVQQLTSYACQMCSSQFPCRSFSRSTSLDTHR